VKSDFRNGTRRPPRSTQAAAGGTKLGASATFRRESHRVRVPDPSKRTDRGFRH